MKSDVFTKKKHAKMHAALLMCIELDKAGELAENLTLLSKEDWLKIHYKDDDEQENSSVKKVGSVKNKQEYKREVSLIKMIN